MVAGDVLVVDDDMGIVDLVVDLLIDEGYTARRAVDGLAAWQAIVQAPPALLVTDIRMPKMTGAELVTRVRAAGYDFPIVIMAATADLAEPLRKLDCVTYLAKPFDVQALLDRVERYVVPAIEAVPASR